MNLYTNVGQEYIFDVKEIHKNESGFTVGKQWTSCILYGP